jgi:hypothetical protein
MASMPAAALDGNKKPTRGMLLFAGAVVLLTLVATWKFVDYRTQPPPPPTVAAPL